MHMLIQSLDIQILAIYHVQDTGQAMQYPGALEGIQNKHGKSKNYEVN